MLTELMAAAGAVKASAELLSLIHATKVSEAVEMKAIELKTIILSLQESCAKLRSDYDKLLDEKNALRAKLIAMESWEAEAVNYESIEISPGVSAYARKPNPAAPTPVHWLCANCFDQKHKSPLQKTVATGTALLGDIYLCARCQATVMVRPKY